VMNNMERFSRTPLLGGYLAKIKPELRL